MNGATNNRIDFGAAGYAAPSLIGNGRSNGTKIVLFPSQVTTDLDFAIGIDLGTLWNSVATSAGQFRWYAGSTTPIATLSGTGNLTVSGTVSTPAITLGGTDLQTSLNNKANTASPTFAGTVAAATLNVTGHTRYKPWVCFESRYVSSAVTILATTGFNTIGASNVVRTATGTYEITFPLHPNGVQLNPVVTSRCLDTDFRYATCRVTNPTATDSKRVVNIRNPSNNTLVDGDFFFHTVP